MSQAHKKEPIKTDAAGEPTHRITLPNQNFKGLRYGVFFEAGVGHTNNASIIEACRSQGYAVEPVKAE